MNERQEKIIAAVIEEYTTSAVPVGSKVLFEKYGISASPATIRHDMSVLEEEGFLYQPHISAGRIPTDTGYRYFVESLMEDRELSKREQIALQEELLKLKAKNSRLSRTTAKLLSVASKNLAISGILDKQEFHDFGMRDLLSEPEFQGLDEVCRIAEALDYVDEMFEKISKEMEVGETKIFIGKENPIDSISNCSMIVSPYELENGEKGVLALIGPKRMKYAKNKSLIEYIKKILGSSLPIIIIFIST
ncbi:MAG: hypothetical protein OEV93_00940 [Candidatus Moranbacteria bacterium]|nr:hypothetical protein [Candidatus Moranbacteria bacterium]